MLDKITLILQNAPVLDFVNGVRTRMGLTKLTELPQSGVHFGAYDCPISTAVAGESEARFATGPYSWTVPGGSDKLLAALIAEIGRTGETAKVRYNPLIGDYYVTQPEFIQRWINTHDVEMGLLRKQYNEERKAQKKQVVDLSSAKIQTYDIPAPGELDGEATETEAEKELVSL